MSVGLGCIRTLYVGWSLSLSLWFLLMYKLSPHWQTQSVWSLCPLVSTAGLLPPSLLLYTFYFTLCLPLQHLLTLSYCLTRQTVLRRFRCK